jgi:hypothetical protein
MVINRVSVVMHSVRILMLEHFSFLGRNQTDEVAQFSVVFVVPLAHDVAVGTLG